MNLVRRIIPQRLYSSIKPTTFEDDYELIQCLGQGSTSRVYLSLNVTTNEQVIVKLFKPIQDYKIQREHRMLTLVKSCPYAQKLQSVIQNKGFNNYGFVFKYYPGETLNKLIKYIELNDIKLYIKQLLMALDCIHKKNIMHRDIKPSNILISKYLESNSIQNVQKQKQSKYKQSKRQLNHIVLLDFGLAESLGPQIKLRHKIGTNCYKPPEILLKRTIYNQKIDIWGIGLILAEMLIKIKPLFKYQQDDIDIIHKVMRRCKNAQQYMTSQQIKQIGLKKYQGITQKSLCSKGIKLAQKMMNFNPKRRPSAQQALKDQFFEGVN